MVSRLNPVRINISFPKKTYRLGDTVSVSVNMTADTESTPIDITLPGREVD